MKYQAEKQRSLMNYQPNSTVDNPMGLTEKEMQQNQPKQNKKLLLLNR
jgi:hypothetical protein